MAVDLTDAQRRGEAGASTEENQKEFHDFAPLVSPRIPHRTQNLQNHDILISSSSDYPFSHTAAGIARVYLPTNQLQQLIPRSPSFESGDDGCLVSWRLDILASWQLSNLPHCGRSMAKCGIERRYRYEKKGGELAWSSPISLGDRNWPW